MVTPLGTMVDRRSPSSRSEALCLVSIVALGAALRTYVWFRGYAQYGVHGLVRHGDGYLEMAASIAGRSDASLAAHWRAYQFIYPLYLAPMFAFDINDSTYVFWLHHVLAAATTCLIYMSARRLCGSVCALLAALAYALHLQVAYWFNWTLADTAFHFQLSLFLLCAIRWWQAPSITSVLWLATSVFLMCFTRPEGFVIGAAFMAGVSFRMLSGRFGAWSSLAVVGGVAACLAGALVYAISQNKPAREKVMSNVDFAWGLYYGSQRTPTRADLVDKMLIEMRVYGDAQAAADVEHRSPWYWNSVAGLDRIRQRPVRYLAFYCERVVNALLPSFFREGVSFKYKLFDRMMSLFLIAGTALSLVATRRTASLVPILVFTSFCVYLLIAFIQSEWDVRVQLSPHVLLIPVASLGWVWALGQFRGSPSVAKSALPHYSSP
jgi:hypothetical protein